MAPSSAAIVRDEHGKWYGVLEEIFVGARLNKLSFGLSTMGYNMHGVSNGKKLQ
ncbi:hypothetical protein PVK06_021137 [Gossypium arboreum]|uniref:Uncharacterized protein n=1 Tax=Gossypium arboreum TaxID=29729 RepID=A0ABR0PPP4_GOSAR|nr:hypothetical protein PVK06_021137 [Gossypium arboreum]